MSYLQFIESSIEQAFDGAANGLRMLELGDQVISDPDISETTGKAYFLNRGFEHVSVDINGLHGAVVRDLTRPEQFQDWHDSWDIITNSGTTEHVEPFESQYECFGILHDCTKVGGIAIHLLPDIHERDEHGAWIDHCHYYYSDSFFEFLAKECGYEILSNAVINGLRCVALKKITNAPFINDRSVFLEWIAQRDYSIDSKGTSLMRRGVRKLLRLVGLS